MKIGTSAVAVAAGTLLCGSLVAGCASKTASSGPAAGGGGSTSASAASQAIVYSTQNGQTVHVAVGGQVALVGFPSSWLPTSSDEAVLSDTSAATQHQPCKNQPPGMQCTEPTLTYPAKAKGTVKLTAHRTQCGEARACVPPESYDFVLTVVVG